MDSGASMHMIITKDLKSAELETVKVSRIPITMVTANGEVQTHEEATVYVKELDLFLTMKVLEDIPSSVVARKPRITDIHMSGPVVKNHVSSKMVFGFNVQLKTSFQMWFQGYRRLLLRQARLVQHLQHQYRKKEQG